MGDHELLAYAVEACRLCGRQEPVHMDRRGVLPYWDARKRLARRCEEAGHESQPIFFYVPEEQSVSDLVPPDRIEDIVGAKRHEEQHLARAVSAEQRVYILHSETCRRDTPDLRECPYSLALDRGIDPNDWRGFEDRPVVLAIAHDQLVPLAPSWLGVEQ